MLPYRATRRSADNSRFSLCNDAYGFRDVGLRRARPIGVLTAYLPISGMRSEMAITVQGRGWRGFHHHATLCIAAYGFLISERDAIPPSASRRRTMPRLPDGYRPRGAADPSRTPRRKLDRDMRAELLRALFGNVTNPNGRLHHCDCGRPCDQSGIREAGLSIPR